MSDIILIVPEKYQNHEQFVTLITQLRILGLYTRKADWFVKDLMTLAPDYTGKPTRRVQTHYTRVLRHCVFGEWYSPITKRTQQQTPMQVSAKGWYSMRDTFSRTLQIKTKVDRAKSK
jgi:hypothetical protein